MTRALLGIGITIQVIALLSIKVPTPLSWQQGWLALSVASLIGIGFVVAAGVTAKGRAAFQIFAFLGSVAGAIGWGSWILVALTSEQGDPVINITGMLCLVGWALTFGAVLVECLSWVRPATSSNRTWAWAFTLAMIVLVAAAFAGSEFGGEAFFGPWLIGSIIVSIVVGTAQIATAWQSANTSSARSLSIAAGAVLLLGSVTLRFTAIILYLVLSIAAAIIELMSSHKSASARVASSETIEE